LNIVSAMWFNLVAIKKRSWVTKICYSTTVFITSSTVSSLLWVFFSCLKSISRWGIWTVVFFLIQLDIIQKILQLEILNNHGPNSVQLVNNCFMCRVTLCDHSIAKYNLDELYHWFSDSTNPSQLYVPEGAYMLACKSILSLGLFLC